MKLYRKEHEPLLIASHVVEAKAFWSRLKGLLGKDSLPESEGLWISQCNSIHTFFMKFSIDAAFLDRDLKVVKLVLNLQPGRITFPAINATSVIEMSAGSKLQKLSLGEQLYVEP